MEFLLLLIVILHALSILKCFLYKKNIEILSDKYKSSVEFNLNIFYNFFIFIVAAKLLLLSKLTLLNFAAFNFNVTFSVAFDVAFSLVLNVAFDVAFSVVLNVAFNVVLKH